MILNSLNNVSVLKKIPNFKFSQMVETVINLQGKPFRFASPANPRSGMPAINRDYLLPLYDNFYPELLLLFGRQSEKSTYLSNNMLVSSLLYPHHHWLYLNASFGQVKDFSKDKLDAMIQQSEILKSKLHDRNSSNVEDKRFKNFSSIKLRGMYRGADRARGITCDSVAVDEIQDIIMDELFVAFEAQSHSEHPERRRLYCGTPKTEVNTIETLRLRSKQHEIIYKCEHCGKSQMIESINVGHDFLQCSKCKKSLKESSSQWMCVNNLDVPLRSFRLPQVLLPITLHNKEKWAEVVKKKETYPTHMFENEVMARSWGNSERPVSKEMLMNCCQDGVKYSNPDSHINTFMGVDYGRGNLSFTVVTVVKIIGKTPHLIYAKKFKGAEADPLFYIPEIVNLKLKYNAIGIGTDAGDGFMQNKTLQLKLGHQLVWIFQATGNLKEDTKYNEDSDNYSFSRTKQLARRFAEIQHGMVKFPDFKICGDILNDFTNVFVQETSKGNIIYNHGESYPDDGVHAWNNALMAAEATGIWRSPMAR